MTLLALTEEVVGSSENPSRTNSTMPHETAVLEQHASPVVSMVTSAQHGERAPAGSTRPRRCRRQQSG